MNIDSSASTTDALPGRLNGTAHKYREKTSTACSKCVKPFDEGIGTTMSSGTADSFFTVFEKFDELKRFVHICEEVRQRVCDHRNSMRVRLLHIDCEIHQFSIVNVHFIVFGPLTSASEWLAGWEVIRFVLVLFGCFGSDVDLYVMHWNRIT